MTKEAPKKVCILGTAETMGDAPFDDESYEIWALAVCGLRKPDELPRQDVIFEMHHREIWKSYADKINAADKPVYMQKHFPEVKNSKPYPLDKMVDTFRRYVTNSISYMVALAIMEEYHEIALFGVHLATDEEYAFERPNLEYFLGQAEGRGINLWIPDEAYMLRSAHLYGYEQNQVASYLGRVIRDAQAEIDKYTSQERNAADAKQQAVGWRECAKHILNKASN